MPHKWADLMYKDLATWQNRGTVSMSWRFAGETEDLRFSFYLAFLLGERGGTTYVQQLCFFKNVDVSNLSNKEMDISKTSSRFGSSWSLTVNITGCLGESAIVESSFLTAELKCAAERVRIHGSRWIWESGMHVAVSIWESGECCDCHVKWKGLKWEFCGSKMMGKPCQEPRVEKKHKCIMNMKRRYCIPVSRNCQICSLPPCCCTLQFFFRSKVGFPERKVVSQRGLC